MGRVPVAPVEHAYRVAIDGWERLEEADEAALVVELAGSAVSGNEARQSVKYL